MKNKTYVITGATSGIGNALLKKLAKDNIVFAGYRNQNFLDDLKELSSNIYPFYVDYSKSETIKEAVKYIHSKCTKVDTIINIAGCVVAGPIEKIEIEEVKRQFDVNVFGHLEFTTNLLDILFDGKIINVSSMASYGIFPFIAPYCASKRALDILFNSLLLENKQNLKIVSIKPGVISTPLWSKSVNENSKYIEKTVGYEKEMSFLINNAKKNEKNGLSVDKVVSTIIKADKARKPKLTYTVGKDAFMARLFSKLPQTMLNKIIKFGLEVRAN